MFRHRLLCLALIGASSVPMAARAQQPEGDPAQPAAPPSLPPEPELTDAPEASEPDDTSTSEPTEPAEATSNSTPEQSPSAPAEAPQAGGDDWFSDDSQAEATPQPPDAEATVVAEPTPPRTEPPLPLGPRPPGHEPPPPPVPRHLAPRTALWLGGRLGWFAPLGNLWSRGVSDGNYVILDPVPWRDYASPGPVVELDVGARLARNYVVFATWERAELGVGTAEATLYGGQTTAETDFWGLGVRASTDPDEIGLLTELTLGYRRFRAIWDDGTELRFTQAPFEARIGIGANIRLTRSFALSPLLTLGAGTFGEIERVTADGNSYSETTSLDYRDSHSWFTLHLGGHFDLLGSSE